MYPRLNSRHRLYKTKKDSSATRQTSALFFDFDRKFLKDDKCRFWMGSPLFKRDFMETAKKGFVKLATGSFGAGHAKLIYE